MAEHREPLQLRWPADKDSTVKEHVLRTCQDQGGGEATSGNGVEKSWEQGGNSAT